MAYFYRAEALRALQLWEQCEADYNQALELAPGWSMFWHRRALLFIARARWHDAEKDLAQAFALPALPDERARQVVSRAVVAGRRLADAVSSSLVAAENKSP